MQINCKTSFCISIRNGGGGGSFFPVKSTSHHSSALHPSSPQLLHPVSHHPPPPRYLLFSCLSLAAGLELPEWPDPCRANSWKDAMVASPSSHSFTFPLFDFSYFLSCFFSHLDFSFRLWLFPPLLLLLLLLLSFCFSISLQSHSSERCQGALGNSRK